jgi:peptidoglycan/LPS O-acetylase OafA/YrhL
MTQQLADHIIENQTARKDESKVYLPQLTGLRAIAALMVFLHHYNPFVGKNIYLFKFFKEFYVGVLIFFVLSGFLIYTRYINNFKEKIAAVDYISYCFGRFVRIYPAYLIIFLCWYIPFPFSPKPHLSEVISGITLTSIFHANMLLPGHFVPIPQAWSLTCEMMFYFSAPFLLILLFIKRVKPVLIVLPWILLGLSLYPVLKGTPIYILGYTFWGRIIEFIVGIYVGYFALFHSSSQLVISKLLASIKLNMTYFGILSTLLILFLMSLTTNSTNSDFGFFHPVGLGLHHVILPFAIGTFILGLVEEKTLISQFLSNKLMILLGNASYVFYLLHIGFLEMFIAKFTHSIFIKLIFITVVSVLFYKFIEEPIFSFLQVYSKKLASRLEKSTLGDTVLLK